MNEGREEQRLFLQSLKRTRIADFRSEVVPYFRYVAQSGFGLAVSAVLFAFIIGYANLLRNVPADIPAGWAGVAAITAAVVWTPLRTYLKAADPVFLLPMESAVIHDYIRPVLLASVRSGIVRPLAVFVVFIPLYVRAPVTEAAAAGRPLWLLCILFGALGAWNAVGAWRERQMPKAFSRTTLKTGRYAASMLSAAALLLGPFLPALAVSIGLILIVSLISRLPPRQALPWDRLIAEEAAAMRRWYRFLSWFVDVPSVGSRPASRRWIAWAGDRITWDRRKAWHYLYAKSFARGETAGALARWYAVVGLIVLVVDNTTADWIAFGIGCWVGGIQLTELAGLRLASTGETLPIGREGRRSAAAAVARIAGTICTAALWLPAAIPQGWPVSWAGLAMLAAGLLWNGWIIPKRMAKPREDDDE